MYNAQWLAMSIVDFSSPQQPSFNYPHTSMTAWLCQSDQNGTFNNSAPQGEIFYQQFQTASQLGNNFYQVNAVSNCKGTEGVPDGVPPQSWITILQQHGLQPTGANAVGYELSDPTSASRCHKLH